MNDVMYANYLENVNAADQMYHLPLFKDFKYSNNVRYFLIECKAYWLIELIMSNVIENIDISESFISINLIVNDNTGEVIFDDGNDIILHKCELSYVDFPLSKFTVWCIDKTIILPQEY